MASANPAVAEAAASGQRDELSESLAELFTNVSLMVRGELQVLSLDSNRILSGGRAITAASSLFWI
jgi:hypothetical protein